MSNGEKAAITHLLRRAAFGARPGEVDYYVQKGYAAAVDDLVSARPLAGGKVKNDSLNVFLARELAPLNETNLRRLQTALIEQFTTSTTPLRERMTLFFHDHFATPFRPSEYVGAAELFVQTEMFRTNALGSWSTLLHKAVEDVALACSLSARENRKDRPNENLAREFMELFAVGTSFGESDVREAARALTGYKVASAGSLNGQRYKLVLDRAAHDNGVKTILGRSGNFGAREFVDILLSQRAAPNFLARRLATAFAMPQPPRSLVSKVAGALVASQWSLSEAMRTLFMSDEFRSAAAQNALVKSPIEFVVGALRAFKRTDYGFAVDWATSAGQGPYRAPNVGGWPGNEAWLSAGGLLHRYTGAVTFAGNVVGKSGYARSDSVDGWASILGISDVAPATRSALNRFTQEARTWPVKHRDRSMIALILSSPDFSLA